jgi:site-specific DNA-methyltransferase (adenine-specific)
MAGGMTMEDRLILGDCLEALPTLAPGSVDMALCDLPYEVTANAWDSAVDLLELWACLRRVLAPGAPVVMFAAAPFDKVLYASNPAAFRYEWAWVKSLPTGFLNANRAPLRQHEAVLVFCDRQPPYYPQFRHDGKSMSVVRSLSSSNYGIHAGWHYASDGRRYPTSVLEFAHEERGQWHPTAKPGRLCAYLVRTYTAPGAVVLDPTMGSGSAGVACVQEGRRFIGIERDATYYATAQERIAAAEAQPRLMPVEVETWDQLPLMEAEA